MDAASLLEILPPFAVVFVAGGFRTIVRRRFHEPDYHLGFELTLAGMAAVVAYWVELGKRVRLNHVAPAAANAVHDRLLVYLFVGTCFCLFLLMLHQKFEKMVEMSHNPGYGSVWGNPAPTRPDRRWWATTTVWLLVVANTAGIVFTASFLHEVREMP